MPRGESSDSSRSCCVPSRQNSPCHRRRQIHRPVSEPRDIDAGPIQQRNEVLLPGLPEDNPIGRELALEPVERLDPPDRKAVRGRFRGLYGPRGPGGGVRSSTSLTIHST